MAAFSSWGSVLPPTNPPPENMEVREWMRNHVDVSFKLANHVFFTVTKTDSNLVFSPLSINVILALLAAGSEGPSLHQLLAFLSAKSTDDLNAFYSRVVSAIFADGSPAGGPRLSVANGAWIEQTLPVKPSFKHVLETVYKAACVGFVEVWA
ncbi:unnamed protein product [Cuscuta campestris]|uniref:Serpin domain-containing protein n=1 Tax=Cuscuta campestris TaxID=132261 RepID=A0A484NDZ7_9ASTE|nr:unnamed protein product [Cuscuta campestris]